MKPDVFRGQAVIITGASAGIGRELARQLANQGARVALAARRADRLDELAKECRLLGGEAVAVPTDVGVEDECRCLVEKTVQTYGKLDMLINNAGLTAIALLDDYHNLELFNRIMAVNFFGAVACSYYAIPHLKQTKGRLVAVSSLGGKLALPYNSPYIASKHALQGFCDSLRMELAPSGVSVTVISPYWVISEFHEAQLNRDGERRGKGGAAVYSRRMMTSEECAHKVLQAAYARRREVVMPPGRLAGWLKLAAPGMLEWLIIQLVLKPAIRRARAGAKGESSRTEG
jgi:short-subunit dehydrogenase